VSAARSALFESWECDEYSIISPPSLIYLLKQCQSLKLLSLKDLKMDENDFRVLGAYSRPDLEINLIRCTLTSAGASALAEASAVNVAASASGQKRKASA
jgi:hypothetical protein